MRARQMLDHVSITVSDLDAAERFYDAIMAAIGVPKVRRSENRLGYGERCDSDHPDRSYLSVKLGQITAATGVSKRQIGQPWMHFGAWVPKTVLSMTGHLVSVQSITLRTTQPS